VCIVTAVLCISGHITSPVFRLSALSHCRELRELEVAARDWDNAELKLLSSITSTKIEKITITHSASFWSPEGHPYWTQLDDILNQLARRLECGLRLEVEFRDVDTPGRETMSDLRKRLPMFVNKGQVRVFDNDGSVYCSGDVGERR
jgi:hypothetical protein